jgi:hypothetical protein
MITRRRLYVSYRGRMYRVENDPSTKRTRCVPTTWAEEFFREKETKR